MERAVSEDGGNSLSSFSEGFGANTYVWQIAVAAHNVYYALGSDGRLYRFPAAPLRQRAVGNR